MLSLSCSITFSDQHLASFWKDASGNEMLLDIHAAKYVDGNPVGCYKNHGHKAQLWTLGLSYTCIINAFNTSDRTRGCCHFAVTIELILEKQMT